MTDHINLAEQLQIQEDMKSLSPEMRRILEHMEDRISILEDRVREMERAQDARETWEAEQVERGNL